MRNDPAAQRWPAVPVSGPGDRKQGGREARVYFRHDALPLLLPVDAVDMREWNQLAASRTDSTVQFCSLPKK
jgi:hypothetical protein